MVSLWILLFEVAHLIHFSDELDAPTRRRLLLVGKTLQNLANFVEFGQKQPYMTAMNVFLRNNKFRMEILVELISVRAFKCVFYQDCISSRRVMLVKGL